MFDKIDALGQNTRENVKFRCVLAILSMITFYGPLITLNQDYAISILTNCDQCIFNHGDSGVISINWIQIGCRNPGLLLTIGILLLFTLAMTWIAVMFGLLANITA